MTGLARPVQPLDPLQRLVRAHSDGLVEDQDPVDSTPARFPHQPILSARLAVVRVGRRGGSVDQCVDAKGLARGCGHVRTPGVAAGAVEPGERAASAEIRPRDSGRSPTASPSVPRPGVTSTRACRISGERSTPEIVTFTHSRIRHVAGNENGQFALDLIRDTVPTGPNSGCFILLDAALQCGSGRSFDLDAFVDLDLISRLDVVVVTDTDSALGARADFVHCRPGIGAATRARLRRWTTLSRSTRIGLLLRTSPSETRQPAMFPNRLERNTSSTSGDSDDFFLELGIEHAGDGLLHRVDHVVDYAEIPQVHELGLDDPRARRRPLAR